MKIEFFENKFGTSFSLTPETVDEVAALARMANNSRSEKPDITFYFSAAPSANVWIRKVDQKAQVNHICKRNPNK